MADNGHAPELRVYLLVRDLQPQFAAYLGTSARARGYDVRRAQDEITEVLSAVAGREQQP